MAGKAEGGARGPWGPPATLSPLDHNNPSSHSNLGWLSYGVLKGDGTLIIVNAVGAVLQTLYILAYLHYSPQKVEALPRTHLFSTPCPVSRADRFLED